MLRTEIDKDEPLYPGDVIEMHFEAYGPNWTYLRASELAMLEWTLRRKHPEWELVRWNQDSAPDTLILTFKILDPTQADPQVQQAGAVAIITGSVIAVAVVGAGLFTWLALKKIVRLTESPAGQVALVGTGSLGIAVLVFAVLMVIRHYSD